MPSSIRKALNELPTTLNETYERALQGIPREKWKHAHHLFQCLLVAIRPLCVEELAELFAIELDQDMAPSFKEGWRPANAEDAVLSACSTLISVIEDKGLKIVQFSHFSVKEFLISERLRTSEIGNIRPYHIPLDSAHAILARACLTVLLQLDENVDKEHLKTFPLAVYAAEHWVDHAKHKDVASQIQDPMERLFNPSKSYLAAWIWIHDVESYRVPGFTHDLEERPTPPKVTALYYAMLYGFSGLANYLILTHGEDVNARCGSRKTALHAASCEGHLDSVRSLLAHGANMKATDKFMRTPLCAAYDEGHLDVMRLLLEHGADPDVHYNLSELLLHDASFKRRADVVHLLLQHNADVNVRNGSQRTPLHMASRAGSARVVQLLLEHGANVNALDNSHETPLHDTSDLAVARILLGHGADIHIRGQRNRTPVQVATWEGHVELAQLLLEHGAGNE